MCNCEKNITNQERCNTNAYKRRRINRLINMLNTLVVIATDPLDVELYQETLNTLIGGECISNESLHSMENFVEYEYNKYSE